MNNTNGCFCGSMICFQDCCQKYIDGIEEAPTALALMKSRYSAYATHNAEYLWNTSHISQRKHHSKSEILHWATANQWLRLEIISATETTVEFKAFFVDQSRQNHVHHEYSSFKQENGSWFYLDGKFEQN